MEDFAGVLGQRSSVSLVPLVVFDPESLGSRWDE